MGAAISDIASLDNGDQIRLVELSNAVMTVKLLNVGATLWKVDLHGLTPARSLCLRHDDPREYLRNEPYFGCTVGPVANRISRSSFELCGESYELSPNEGRNHLHGGPTGFGNRIWTVEVDPALASAHFGLKRAAGEGGYPADLEVTVTWTLKDDALMFEWSAVANKPTPVSLTSHAYWNLSTAATIEDHRLTVDADCLVEVDDELLPTGRLLSVGGAPYDLNNETRLGDAIERVAGAGIDHCYAMNPGGGAVLTAPAGDVQLQVHTSLPGIQVYTGHMLDGSQAAAGQGPYRGVCLETQYFPDSPNRPEFPSCVLEPGVKKQHWTSYRFVEMAT